MEAKNASDAPVSSTDELAVGDEIEDLGHGERYEVVTVNDAASSITVKRTNALGNKTIKKTVLGVFTNVN